jgi:hypothetical protein
MVSLIDLDHHIICLTHDLCGKPLKEFADEEGVKMLMLAKELSAHFEKRRKSSSVIKIISFWFCL